MMLKRWIAVPALALASALGAGGFGCAVQAEPVPVVVTEPTQPPTNLTGTLTVRWTIDGVNDPNECVKSIAVDLELTVFDVNGNPVGTFNQACESFGLSVTLNPGDYDASAVLLDGAGQPRTTTLNIAPFTIRGNDVLDVPIDFPASSFLQ